MNIFRGMQYLLFYFLLGLASQSAQFPIMYAKGIDYQYSFFYDNVYGQTWDMTDPSLFKVTSKGNPKNSQDQSNTICSFL